MTMFSLGRMLSRDMSDAPPRLIAVEGARKLDDGQRREAQALERLAAGDLDALGDLYDLHQDAVRSLARRLLGDVAAVEDLVHDVFLELNEAAPRLRGTGPVRNYLLGIAANLSRHHLRSARRRRDAFDRLEVEPHSPSTPEHDLAREQLASLLQRALDGLSHEHRVTFVLCELEERSGPEVAAILKIPEATVRTRLFHAKRKLRELLGEIDR